MQRMCPIVSKTNQQYQLIWWKKKQMHETKCLLCFKERLITYMEWTIEILKCNDRRNRVSSVLGFLCVSMIRFPSSLRRSPLSFLSPFSLYYVFWLRYVGWMENKFPKLNTFFIFFRFLFFCFFFPFWNLIVFSHFVSAKDLSIFICRQPFVVSFLFSFSSSFFFVPLNSILGL